MNENRWLALVISLLLITMTGISSCRNTGGKPITFKNLYETQSWRIGEGTNYLVVDENNWSSYFSTIPTNADFTRNIYFVASLGTRPNPAYTIKVLGVSQLGDEVKIKLELGEPAKGKFYPQLVVYPIVVAEVPKNQLQQGKLLSFIFVDQKGTQLTIVKKEM